MQKETKQKKPIGGFAIGKKLRPVAVLTTGVAAVGATAVFVAKHGKTIIKNLGSGAKQMMSRLPFQKF